MNRNETLERTAAHVRQTLGADPGGHDWQHVERVARMARRLAVEEGADPWVVELAALLHDIADWKFHDGDREAGPLAAAAWLDECGVDEEVRDRVCAIVRDLSFRGAGVPTPMNTIEGQVVQDADRLDAMGAIGIARAFAYGGSRGRQLHDPDSAPVRHQSFDAYRRSRGSTVNHFHEKLLLLAERMNTATARRIATRRHQFMERFLARFDREWRGEE